jgi:hypothetical protein
MRLAGTTSWQISVDNPQHLGIGLYVRAAAGLGSAHSWLPAVTPAVAATRTDTEAAVPQWERWWDAAVRHPNTAWAPPFDELAGSPELRSHVSRHFMDAVRWTNRRPALRLGGSLLETDLVSELEAAAGRRAEPFALQVSCIPCAGLTMWQLAPDHVLVTEDLLADDVAYRRRLAVVVQALL